MGCQAFPVNGRGIQREEILCDQVENLLTNGRKDRNPRRKVGRMTIAGLRANHPGPRPCGSGTLPVSFALIVILKPGYLIRYCAKLIPWCARVKVSIAIEF